MFNNKHTHNYVCPMLKKTSAPNFLNIIFISCLMKTLQNLQWSIYTPLQKQIPHLCEVLSSLQCTNQTYASFLISVALGDSAYVSSEIHKQSYCLSAVVKDWKLLPETTAWEKTIFSEIIMIKLSIILENKGKSISVPEQLCMHPPFPWSNFNPHLLSISVLLLG